MPELLKRPETLVDIYRLLPEGTPIQVLDNQFFISPAPNVPRFRIVDSISDKLLKIVKESDLGQVFFCSC